MHVQNDSEPNEQSSKDDVAGVAVEGETSLSFIGADVICITSDRQDKEQPTHEAHNSPHRDVGYVDTDNAEPIEQKSDRLGGDVRTQTFVVVEETERDQEEKDPQDDSENAAEHKDFFPVPVEPVAHDKVLLKNG